MMKLTNERRDKMKKIVVVPALLGAMAIGGILTLSTDLIGSADNSDIITMAEAEKKALEAVKGKVVEIEKEKEGTKIYYEVEIETKDAEYELKIDALTGDVLKNKKELHDDDDDWDNDWDDDRYDD